MSNNTCLPLINSCMSNNTYLLLERAFSKLSASQLVEFSEVFGEVYENISDNGFDGASAHMIVADILEIIDKKHHQTKEVQNAQ